MNDALQFIVLIITYLLCILFYKNNNIPKKVLNKIPVKEPYKLIIIYIIVISLIQIFLTEMLSGINEMMYSLILGAEMGVLLSFIPYIAKKK